jgi:ATP/ADP translocase
MTTTTRSTVMAMACAAAVTAQFVGAKATRDALFLTSLDFTALPAMLIATSICSILLVMAHTRWTVSIAPATAVPLAFVASGLLFVGEWFVRASAPSSTAVFVYLHVSGAGPLLASGFWLIATERFDPRTAKRRFGQISSAGTVGGLLGALLSAHVSTWGVPSMLLVLAALQFLSAWVVRRLAVRLEPPATRILDNPVAEVPSARSGLRVVGESPHLRHLAALVLLGTTSAALVEYLFKAKALETLGPGDHLLRFFSLYYAATSFLTLLVQLLLSRRVLDRFGLAMTMSTPSIALLAGSVAALVAPSFGGVVVTRAGESIFRGSWFRSSYELFYTPIPAAEKRAAKSVVDVAFDRLGDAVGGGLVRFAVLLSPIAAASTILTLAIVASAGAIFMASRLNFWYVRLLERSLVKQGDGIDVSATADEATRQVLRRIRHDADEAARHHAGSAPEARHSQSSGAPEAQVFEAADASGPQGSQASDASGARAFQASGNCAPHTLDPEILDILVLRTRNRARIVDMLSREDGLTPVLVPHVIPLLAWEPVADYAFFALRKVAEERIGELADALLNPGQNHAVRLGIARVLSVCVSQRAADSLVLALDDSGFDVRAQAARSLAAMMEKNPLVRIDDERIYSAVLAEVSLEDEPVSRRVSQVFSLLSLVLPREPLQIAYRGLQSSDRQLRGTALEYLEGVLPAGIRAGLWPLLVRRVPAASPRFLSPVSSAPLIVPIH